MRHCNIISLNFCVAFQARYAWKNFPERRRYHKTEGGPMWNQRCNSSVVVAVFTILPLIKITASAKCVLSRWTCNYGPRVMEFLTWTRDLVPSIFGLECVVRGEISLFPWHNNPALGFAFYTHLHTVAATIVHQGKSNKSNTLQISYFVDANT